LGCVWQFLKDYRQLANLADAPLVWADDVPVSF
jgi:hypothetical protein